MYVQDNPLKARQDGLLWAAAQERLAVQAGATHRAA
jgi:hypothetical protein